MIGRTLTMDGCYLCAMAKAEAGRMLTSVDAKGRFVLPEEVRRRLGVRGGGVLLLGRTPYGTYELVPPSLVPKDQRWFYHPGMQAQLARAEADFAAGRSKTTRTPQEA